jgi:nitrate/nitrite transporter NarK
VRNTDRLVTPAVVVTFLLVAGVLVGLTIAAVAYLTARGLDPDPMVKLVASLVGAAGGLGTFVLQLANNSRTAKTERNTGVLGNAVYELADALPRAAPARHAYEDTTVMQTAAPGPRGS